MSGLPAAGVGDANDLAPAEAGLWRRARRLAGNKLGYALADQVVYSFGNMVVAALLSRHAPAREFGIYILTQRAMDVVLQLSNVFLWAPYTFNLPGTERARQAQFLGSVMLHQLVVCAAAAVVIEGMKLWAHTPSRGLYYGVFAPLVWTSAGIAFREFTRRMYFAEIRFREAFWTDAATVALQIAGVEWLLRTGRLSVSATLWVLCAGAVIVSLWWLARDARRLVFDARAAHADLRQNMKLGRWFLGSNMVFLVSAQCNPWVLGAMLDGTSVGMYAVCESVVNIPRVALNSLQNMMAPLMARAFADGGRAQLGALVKRLNAALLPGAVVCGVGVALLGPWVARAIFHARPEHARLVLAVLAANLVAFAATLAWSFGLSAMDRAAKTFYAYAAGLLVQVVVLVPLVRSFTIAGAAGALLAGTTVVAVVLALYFAREMRSTAAEVRL